MLVDSQPPPSAFNNAGSFPTSFEDFFNMDLVAAAASSPSSSSSPHSPPHSSFPITPPQPQPMQSFFNNASFEGNAGMGGISGDPSEFLNMYLDDDFSKPIIPCTTAAPYDFFNFSFDGSSSSSSGSPHTMTTDASPSGFTIDPQLVETPSAGQAPSDFDQDHDEVDEDGDEELEADEPIIPVKVGGKGKARKGTVASGGIKKSSPVPTSAVGKEIILTTTSTDHKIEDRDSDDWRPSPEEYKKMTSKEKRQLRNKISARNFRVRRKEYISTLEADISERDALINAIRTELGSSKSENVALRQEIAALKRSLLAGRGSSDIPVLPPPAPLSPAPTVSAAPSPAASTSNSNARSQSPLFAPNTQKDLPSMGAGTRGFWGGVGLGGGYTPVHTTFVPPLSAVLARKNVTMQENLNPNLNGNIPIPHRVPSPPITNPSPFAPAPTNTSANGINRGINMAGVSGFDAFADMNPFTLKTLDAYRMQLWGKMAAQNHAYQQQQQAQQQQAQFQQQQSQQQMSQLADRMRPAFFSSAVLAGKSTTSGSVSYPSPPSSPPARSATLPALLSSREKEAQRDVLLATMASQTLFSKLGSAFWGAFAGESTSSTVGSGSKQWDADKVRRVLEGKAVVRVVDVESPPTTPKVAPLVAPAFTRSTSAPSPTQAQRECSARACMADILAESMGSLSLGKK